MRRSSSRRLSLLREPSQINEEPRKRREEALAGLGRSVAAAPFSVAAVRDALDLVAAEGGEELVVEAVATAGFFEAMTRIADATGKVPHAASELRMMLFVSFVMQNWHLALAVAVAILSMYTFFWTKESSNT